MPFGYSVRGHCRTERRKDRWFCNPKGIVSSSPGLPSPRGYPGLASVRFSTPTGLCPISAIGPQPRWGWPTPPAFPRVARGSQPWASGRNPFGIQLWNIRKALALAWELRSPTTMPLAWIAERLNMGTRGHLAWLLQATGPEPARRPHQPTTAKNMTISLT